jgi:sensor domain CHASE-containing protein
VHKVTLFVLFVLVALLALSVFCRWVMQQVEARLISASDEELEEWVQDSIAWGESSSIYYNEAKRRKDKQGARHG